MGDPFPQGGNRHEGCAPVKAEVKRVLGKWECVVTYRVLERKTDNDLVLGVDMNVGQIATSAGEILSMPDTSRLEARKRRYQRMMARRRKGSNRRAKARHLCARTARRIASVRADWQHKTSRTLADQAGTVVVEDLKVRNMTKSAKGTVEAPGKQVQAKSGLNREILKTGWCGLRQKIGYKVHTLLEVNPSYTSQTCSRCGHRDGKSRGTQSGFRCVSCGYEVNADVNAALNIKALGIGASGRGDCTVGWSGKRQNVNFRSAA